MFPETTGSHSQLQQGPTLAWDMQSQPPRPGSCLRLSPGRPPHRGHSVGPGEVSFGAGVPPTAGSGVDTFLLQRSGHIWEVLVRPTTLKTRCCSVQPAVPGVGVGGPCHLHREGHRPGLRALAGAQAEARNVGGRPGQAARRSDISLSLWKQHSHVAGTWGEKKPARLPSHSLSAAKGLWRRSQRHSVAQLPRK